MEVGKWSGRTADKLKVGLKHEVRDLERHRRISNMLKSHKGKD